MFVVHRFRESRKNRETPKCMEKTNKAQRTLLVKELARKYNVTTSYVYKALGGQVSNMTTDALRRDYARLSKAINQAIQNHQ